MPDQSVPIVILGAGASGLMAAIAAARVRPHSVMLLEKEARVGRKLLATGNGRCNLLNMRIGESSYHGGGAETAKALLRLRTPAALLSHFESLGLTCREEAEGRVYPFSGQASSVLDVMRLACARAGVQTRTEASVTSIRKIPDGFALTLHGGERIMAQRVILAGGGKASPAHGSDGSGHALLAALGHTITPTFPAIVPLKLPVQAIRGLKGIRTPVRLTLYVQDKPVHTEDGEALFTDYGISGVAAMQMARYVQEALAARKKPMLSISLMSEKNAACEVERRAAVLAGETMTDFCTGLLHRRLGECLLRAARIDPAAPVTGQAANALLPYLHDWRLPVEGTLPFANAQVTAGGADMAEFDGETLVSIRVPGLYACGELLDVDGACGGYNLMWAWASGLTAGEAAARSLDTAAGRSI